MLKTIILAGGEQGSQQIFVKNPAGHSVKIPEKGADFYKFMTK